ADSLPGPGPPLRGVPRRRSGRQAVGVSDGSVVVVRDILWCCSAASVDRPGGNHPFARLTGDLRDHVEVGVVMDDRQTVLLGGRGDQQVGPLSAPLTSPRQETLYLTGAANMFGGSLDQLEHA